MATPLDNVVPLTGNPLIDGLTWGAAWQFGGGPQTLSYSLSLNDNPNGGAWSVALSDAARLALAEWAKVANLSFVESGSGTVYNQSPAEIAIILTGNELATQFPGVAAVAIPPSPALANATLGAIGEGRASYPQPEGDVALDNYYSGFAYLDPGGIGEQIMLHEIGHALGLKHTDDASTGRPTFASLGIANLDSSLYTVMSYTDAAGQHIGTVQDHGNAATPMPLDILAIQQIYGANTSYHTGDDIYPIIPAGASAAMLRTVWDAGGNDTLTVDPNSGDAATLDLREGHYSRIYGSQLAIAYHVVIENAEGGARDDTLIGNAADNRLDGRGGDDSMSGGAGNDTYVVDAGGDVVDEPTAAGSDTIVAAVGYTLPDNVENLTLSGAAKIDGNGNNLDNILLGNAARNTLAGGAGNDYLDGDDGVDTLLGGSGNDIYIVAQIQTETPNTFRLEGAFVTQPAGGTNIIAWSQTPTFFLDDRTADGLIDFLQIFYPDANSSFNLWIGSDKLGQNLAVGSYANAERASNASPGHPGLDLGYNGISGNTVYGSFTIAAIDIDYSGAAPTLQRLGLTFELHADSPTAPATFGNFNYNYSGGDVSPETVIELPNEGNDEVRASISYALADHVEKLTLTGTAKLDGSGNGVDNRIVGNSGNNFLAGLDGNDMLDGGGGNDTLDGGMGTDEAHFSGNRTSYAMALDPSGVYTVSGASGSSRLTAIERAVFADAANYLPNGTVGVGGTAIQGQTLSASHSLTDADGLGTLGYQWLADGVAIIGANSGSLIPTQFQVGKAISVAVSYTDGQGTLESATSNATGIVANSNDAPFGSMVIGGTPTPGQTLSAASHLVDADGLGTVSLQWQSSSDGTNWSAIADATASTFALTADRIGQYVRAVGSYTDGFGAAESVGSAPIAVYDVFPGRSADLLAYSWKSHVALTEVVVDAGGASQATGNAGTTSLAGITDTSFALTVSRAIPSAETALTAQAANLQDAIAVLKMIVGLEVNGTGRPLSPYQAYAADFDGDGAVNLTDAIKILKHVVGLDAPNPAWTFFNEATAPTMADHMHPGAVPAINADLAAATTSVHVGLVGVLRGDVDGSFGGASGAPDLDVTQPTYFQNIAATHDLNLSQFGIYPA